MSDFLIDPYRIDTQEEFLISFAPFFAELFYLILE